MQQQVFEIMFQEFEKQVQTDNEFCKKLAKGVFNIANSHIIEGKHTLEEACNHIILVSTMGTMNQEEIELMKKDKFNSVHQ